MRPAGDFFFIQLSNTRADFRRRGIRKYTGGDATPPMLTGKKKKHLKHEKNTCNYHLMVLDYNANAL